MSGIGKPNARGNSKATGGDHPSAVLYLLEGIRHKEVKHHWKP